MTMRTLTCLLAITICSTTQAQSYRNQDAGVGGLAGAVIGGIIGHQNDETAEGALIGGAVGAIAGGLLGNEKDRRVQHHRYYHQQARQVRQPYYPQQARHQTWQRQPAPQTVSISDVMNMSESGLSDAVIVNHIQTNGVTDKVGTHEIIAMHNRGVSEHVITAMQQAHQPTTVTQRDTVIVEQAPPTPVIVRKEVRVVPNPLYVPPPRVRYATRPAFPQYPSRSGFYRYW